MALTLNVRFVIRRKINIAVVHLSDAAGLALDVINFVFHVRGLLATADCAILPLTLANLEVRLVEHDVGVLSLLGLNHLGHVDGLEVPT